MKDHTSDPFETETSPFGLPKFDMKKMMAMMKIPGVDMDQMMATQEKHKDAFGQALKVALQGYRDVSESQSKFQRAAILEASRLATELKSVKSMQEKMAKQAEFAKGFTEKMLDNMRATSETLMKAHMEAFGKLSASFGDTLSASTKSFGK